MSSNRDEQKVENPNLQNTEVISKMIRGEPWYDLEKNSAELSNSTTTELTTPKTTVPVSRNSTTDRSPVFRSDIKMIRRANITAPVNKTGDQDFEYFYYYYYDYVYPDELEDLEDVETLPKPVPLNNVKDVPKAKKVLKKVKKSVRKLDSNYPEALPVPRPLVSDE